MLSRVFRIWTIAFFLLLLLGACKKNSKAHFSGKPQRQIKQKEKFDKRDLNDCEQLEKQRIRKEKETVKRKRLLSKEAEDKERVEGKVSSKEVTKKGQDKVKYKGGRVVTRGNGAIIYIKIGLVVLLGLAAIGFAISLIVFALISIALSILLIPLVLTVGWFAIAGIAFAAISLVNQIRRRRIRRRRKRKRRRKEANEDETPDDLYLEEEPDMEKNGSKDDSEN